MQATYYINSGGRPRDASMPLFSGAGCKQHHDAKAGNAQRWYPMQAMHHIMMLSQATHPGQPHLVDGHAHNERKHRKGTDKLQRQPRVKHKRMFLPMCSVCALVGYSLDDAVLNLVVMVPMCSVCALVGHSLDDAVLNLVVMVLMCSVCALVGHSLDDAVLNLVVMVLMCSVCALVGYSLDDAVLNLVVMVLMCSVCALVG